MSRTLNDYYFPVVDTPVVEPVLIEKAITENGTYTAADDEADGYSAVTVNVSGSVPEHYISYDAFNDYGNVTAISVVGLTKIPEYAFYKMTTLETVNLMNGIKQILSYAFSYSSIKQLILPEGLVSIDISAINDCRKLTLVSLPESLTEIGITAFQNCVDLPEITFKSKPSVLAKNAFSGCVDLKTINVPWSEGEVADAPWGATKATINYNYVPE